MKSTVLVLTCEHAVNTVPAEYLHLFADQESNLEGPHAYDAGAHALATHISHILGCDYIHTHITRLLIDCHLNPHHEHFFSPFTHTLSSEEKQHLIETYSLPFRAKIHERIRMHIAAGRQVLHVSIHSFSNEAKELAGHTALGLLYNPRRHGEREVVRLWKSILSQHDPIYRVRINYPHSGMHIHVPSELRTLHDESEYLNIVLEINQKLLQQTPSIQDIERVITTSLTELMQVL